jgi:hypothetical protein
VFACLGFLVFWALSVETLSLSAAPFSLPVFPSASSVSGQFLVIKSPGDSLLDDLPEIAQNQDLARLEPALLAVSADRFRESFLNKLGVNPTAQWSGKIYLVLHPAQSLDENVEIISSRLGDGWDYHVLIPDVVPRERLARALTAVLLLEYANRNATDRSAEVPPWLVDGLAQELLNENLQDLILSTPSETMNGLPYSWMDQTEHSVDPLANARNVLQTYSILTFAQLSWPTDAQLFGEDGGAYRASAQLFTHELLALPNGGAKIRAMIGLLPRYYNWQTAFWPAFKENFSNSLQVEKWWALQSVIFASRSPGPQWTRQASREKLDEILSVPVEYRGTSNSLPTYAAVSLQKVIQNFNSAQQLQILQTKLRDLEMAQLRMDSSLAVLTAEYRNALAEYLGEAPVKRNGQLGNRQATKVVSARDTIRILNTLDAQRRALILAVHSNAFE